MTRVNREVGACGTQEEESWRIRNKVPENERVSFVVVR
jgi:hypothetical protein